jgi:hypothetical protein
MRRLRLGHADATQRRQRPPKPAVDRPGSGPGTTTSPATHTSVTARAPADHTRLAMSASSETSSPAAKAGSSTPTCTTSAQRPASSTPMSPRPRASAPPRVASNSASAAITVTGSRPVTRARRAAVRASSRMSRPSLLAGPSVPSPIGTPAARGAGSRRTPEASLALDDGQCAAAAPARASRPMSASDRCTAWAARSRVSSRPTDSRSAGTDPNCARCARSSSSAPRGGCARAHRAHAPAPRPSEAPRAGST